MEDSLKKDDFDKINIKELNEYFYKLDVFDLEEDTYNIIVITGIILAENNNKAEENLKDVYSGYKIKKIKVKKITKEKIYRKGMIEEMTHTHSNTLISSYCKFVDI